MSTVPKTPAAPPAERLPLTVPEVLERKRRGEPLVMVTAYDFPSGQVAEEAGVDLVLVGDSGAMTVLGYPSTVEISIEEMLTLCKAVRRAVRTPLLVADLPFASYEASKREAIRTAQRFVKEGGAEAVKLEGGGLGAKRAKAIVAAGIPVIGHVGLTPQTATALGGYRAQGRTANRALELLREALALQEAGCFAIVLEAVPAAVTAEIVSRLEVPTIGIGAGPATDGQVLVFHDLLGIYAGHQPRFAKRYANLREEMVAGVRAFAQEVRERRFPTADHTYSVSPEELARFQELAAAEGSGSGLA
jgi:3-methyl-2-oxobutanoate hydroxymethyltransferase